MNPKHLYPACKQKRMLKNKAQLHEFQDLYSFFFYGKQSGLFKLLRFANKLASSIS